MLFKILEDLCLNIKSDDEDAKIKSPKNKQERKSIFVFNEVQKLSESPLDSFEGPKNMKL